MGMKDLAASLAILPLGGFYGGNPLESSSFNNYNPPKLKGYTEIKGRKKLSKKKRKELKAKKQWQTKEN